jgi:hypothetical protein
VTDLRELRDRLNGVLHTKVEDLAHYLYPQGKKKGHSWRVGSLDINFKKGLWGDWDGSTEGMSPNLIDLWIYATKSDFKTAVQDIERWLGIPESEWPSRPEQSVETPKKDRKIIFPLLEKPTATELQTLSKQRSLPVQALDIAVRREFLWTYTDPFEKTRAWLLTDSTRRLAVGRRLDGQAWQTSAKGAKSKSLYGSLGNWPIGIKETAAFPAIGLVEGTPDFLALIAHAWEKKMQNHIAPVCIAGAQMSIPQEALPYFIGKRVRIFVHADDAGIAAAGRWYSQLKDNSEVDGYSFDGLTQIDGQPVTDLNELCRIAPESREAHRQDLESLLDLNTKRESN